MAKLIWSPAALHDLEEICEYIARDSEHYARLFAERVVALVETIPDHPRLGARVPEYDREDIRERLFQNYRVIYRLRGDIVEMVRITHGARLLPPTLPAD